MHETLTNLASDVAPANDSAKMPCTGALTYDDAAPSSSLAASGLLGECDNDIEALFDNTNASVHTAQNFELFFGTTQSSPVASSDMLVESDKELAVLIDSTSVLTHAAQDFESVFGTTSTAGKTSTEAQAIQSLLAISTLALPLPVSAAPRVVPLVDIKRKIKVCQCDLSSCDATAIFDNVRLTNTSCVLKGGVQGETIRLDMRKNGFTTTKKCKCEKPFRYYLCCDECPENWIVGQYAAMDGIWKQSVMANSPHDKTIAFRSHLRGIGHIFWRTVRAMGGIVKEAQVKGILITNTVDWIQNEWTIDHWKRCCNVVNKQRTKFPRWCCKYDSMIPGILNTSKAEADPTSVAMKFQVAGLVLQFIAPETYEIPKSETDESDIPPAYSSTRP